MSMQADRRLRRGVYLAPFGELADPSADVTELGVWGPWVDGGGWLRIDGIPVDWIYRDLERVRAAWEDARRQCLLMNFLLSAKRMKFSNTLPTRRNAATKPAVGAGQSMPAI